jgi:cell division protease FtsH
MLGGRAAENVVFKEMTAGAANDIKNATRYAKAMVVDLGMSSLGPTNFGATSETGEFGNMEWYESPSISPATQEKVDVEIKKIIDTGLITATKVVKKNRKLLDKVVKVLMEKETIDRDEFEKIVGGKKQ